MFLWLCKPQRDKILDIYTNADSEMYISMTITLFFTSHRKLTCVVTYMQTLYGFRCVVTEIEKETSEPLFLISHV